MAAGAPFITLGHVWWLLAGVTIMATAVALGRLTGLTPLLAGASKRIFKRED